jgi:hypothetical protein
VDVLRFLEVAVIQVGARVVRAVEVGQVTGDRDADRGMRLSIEDRDGVAETVEVKGVGVDQVGANLQAKVGKLEGEILLFTDPE